MIDRAIQLMGMRELAKALGVSVQAVHKWKVGKVPAERVLAIERATNGRITRHELRPDLYPIEPTIASRWVRDAETAQ